MLVCDRTKCTGCGVCADACPKNCIQIKYDKDGFLQSYVDEARCVQCKLCSSVCPANNPGNQNPVQKAYKVRRKDTAAILKSTSGGVAALLAEAAVSSGVAVCGCGFDEMLTLRHTLEKELPALEKFKGSKYIQSNTSGIYQQVKQQLTAGEKVLFIGTPCQVSGLNSYLKKAYDNLYTVDLICHGVGSTKVLEQYLQKYSCTEEKIRNVTFRAKKDGYIESNKNDLLLEYDDRQQAVPFSKGIVLWFAAGISLRESCYSCNFVSTQRCADITLADYIGTDLTPEDRQFGVSTVLVNTPKGQKMLELVRNQAFVEEKPLEDILSRYARLNHKRTPPKVRKKFFRDLQKHTLEQMEEKYTLKRILPGKLTLYTRAAIRKIKGIVKGNR